MRCCRACPMVDRSRTTTYRTTASSSAACCTSRCRWTGRGRNLHVLVMHLGLFARQPAAPGAGGSGAYLERARAGARAPAGGRRLQRLARAVSTRRMGTARPAARPCERATGRRPSRPARRCSRSTASTCAAWRRCHALSVPRGLPWVRMSDHLPLARRGGSAAREVARGAPLSGGQRGQNCCAAARRSVPRAAAAAIDAAPGTRSGWPATSCTPTNRQRAPVLQQPWRGSRAARRCACACWSTASAARHAIPWWRERLAGQRRGAWRCFAHSRPLVALAAARPAAPPAPQALRGGRRASPSSAASTSSTTASTCTTARTAEQAAPGLRRARCAADRLVAQRRSAQLRRLWARSLAGPRLRRRAARLADGSQR
jgi:hypothetical protein